jgi:hypothetical protein
MTKLGIGVDIYPRPVEMPMAVRFDEDHLERPYDRAWVEAFFGALVQANRVLRAFRAEFVGKASPVHFFWGSFDLAATRFSGRRAPRHPGGVPNVPDWVTQESYSHECASAGFWPGGGGLDEAAFYAYAYPAPPGFDAAPVLGAGARFESDLGEFILPYELMRTSPDPDRELVAFLHSNYLAAAELGGWDRASLERPREERWVEEAGAALH